MDNFINLETLEITDGHFLNALINIQHYIKESELPLYIDSINININNFNYDDENDENYTMNFKLKFNLDTYIFGNKDDDSILLNVDIPPIPFEQIEFIYINGEKFRWYEAIKTKYFLKEMLNHKKSIHERIKQSIEEVINRIDKI